MKNQISLFVILLVSFLSYGQSEKFELTEENSELVGQYVVIKKDSMSVSDGYNKVLGWINVNYNTPKEVIKAQLENEYIRIEGINQSISSQKILGSIIFYKGKYSLTFEFKQDKIKMELTNLMVYNKPSQTTVGGWIEQRPTYSSQFRKNGKPRKSIVQYYNGFNDSMNDLKLSLQDFVDNETKSITKKDDW